ncbi:flagellar assembly FliH family protein [Collimonas fungivorans]|uniref:Flagellar assembly protein FliH n=1 Tax=Collimonas fungivorans TaxID=158899 RepID=A0A127PDQ9_9BURK|nr:FliH/SctL family protein [Collimonas fungivorans]AMO95581.1 flagellar assembly FliH family protein [Collimonas fungivorans]
MDKDSNSQVLHRLELHPLPRVLSRPHVSSEMSASAGKPEVRIQIPETSVVASLAEIQEQARNEGYQQGLLQGQADGNRLGHEEGFRSGRLEGLAAAEKENSLSVQQAIDAARETMRKQEAQLGRLLETIPARIADCLARAEDDMVALAHESVCRILGGTVVSSEGVRQAVKQAMAQLRSSEQIVIRLHPGDYQLIADAAPLLPGREVSCVSDNQVSLGGCLIDYPQGTLDARLETQLRQFTDLLLRIRQSASAEIVAGASAADLAVLKTNAQSALPDRQEE